MNKVAHYLQQHLTGEILTSPDVLEHFSTDESILQLRPLLVAHPRSEQDIRKTARFSWQLAERGKVIPITIRGKGCDQTGGAIGRGIVVSTTAHLNKIVQLDPKSGEVTVQVGTNAAKLQQALYTHGRYIPSFPVDDEQATIGGLISNNSNLGEAYAFGPIGEFVERLRIVLANGELIETSRLNKRELNKKLGLASFEGEIYRSLDSLIEENSELIDSMRQSATVLPGYNLADVKLSDGSFDLTPLIVGSQGTLGLITEATLRAQQHDPNFEMLVAFYDDTAQAVRAVEEINAIKKTPLSIDFIDGSVVEYAKKVNPSLLKNTFGSSIPKMTLFITYNDKSNMTKRDIKKMHKIIEAGASDSIDVDKDQKDAWVAASHLPGIFLAHSEGDYKPLPIVPGAVVPIHNLVQFIETAKELLNTVTGRHSIVYGQAGSGVVQVAPLFNISQLGDRQKIVKLIDEYYALVAEAGGSTGNAVKVGRLLNSQLNRFLTSDQLDLMRKVKKIFDPYLMLNPGVISAGNLDSIKTMLRENYSLASQHTYFPKGK